MHLARSVSQCFLAVWVSAGSPLWNKLKTDERTAGKFQTDILGSR